MDKTKKVEDLAEQICDTFTDYGLFPEDMNASDVVNFNNAKAELKEILKKNV